MVDEFNTDVVRLAELNKEELPSIPETPTEGVDACPFDDSTMYINEYVLEPHMGVGTPEVGSFVEDIPEDTLLGNGFEESDETSSVNDRFMDYIPEDVPELNESQLARLADLDEGYVAVVSEGEGIIDSILEDESITRSGKIEALKNLRYYEAGHAADYHTFRQEILDNPDDSGPVLKKTLHL